MEFVDVIDDGHVPMMAMLSLTKKTTIYHLLIYQMPIHKSDGTYACQRWSAVYALYGTSKVR